MPTPPARPPALLLTCIFLGVAAALMLLELVDALSAWNSVALQDAVRDALKEEPLASTDITQAQATSWLRVLAYGGVVLAVAVAVFSVFTARGDRTSRIMLTILCALAALLFAAGGLVGLLPAFFLLMCASSLWAPDVRRWFDAVNGTPTPAASALAGGPAATSTTSPAVVDPSAAPDAPAATGGTAGTTVQTGPGAARAGERPASVRTALVASAVAHAALALGGVVALLGATVGADGYREELRQEGFLRDLMSASAVSVDAVLLVAVVMASGCIVVAVLGLAGTVFATRPRRGAKLVLQLGLGFACVAAFVAIPFGIVTLVLAVVGFVQLEKPDARAWFTS